MVLPVAALLSIVFSCSVVVGKLSKTKKQLQEIQILLPGTTNKVPCFCGCLVISIHFQCKDLVHSTETTIPIRSDLMEIIQLKCLPFTNRCPFISFQDWICLKSFPWDFECVFHLRYQPHTRPRQPNAFWICLVKQQPLFHGKDLGFPSSNWKPLPFINGWLSGFRQLYRD